MRSEQVNESGLSKECPFVVLWCNEHGSFSVVMVDEWVDVTTKKLTGFEESELYPVGVFKSKEGAYQYMAQMAHRELSLTTLQ